jgi:hypothetical protein
MIGLDFLGGVDDDRRRLPFVGPGLDVDVGVREQLHRELARGELIHRRRLRPVFFLEDPLYRHRELVGLRREVGDRLGLCPNPVLAAVDRHEYVIHDSTTRLYVSGREHKVGLSTPGTHRSLESDRAVST